MRRLIAIVPNAKADAINKWLAAAVGENARDTFTVGVNASGNPDRPITHRVCNWLMSETDYLLVTAELSKAKYGSVKLAEGSPFLDDDGMTKGRDFMETSGMKKIRTGGND